MKDKLLIAIDPGFDAYKIVVNEHTYHFSSKMLDVTTETYGVDRRPKGSYYLRLAEERNNRIVDYEYLIGDVTELSMHSATIVANNAQLLSDLQATSKFSSDNFKISLQGALALALYLYQKDDKSFSFARLEKNEYDVAIAVALPHDYVTKAWSTVKQFLQCKHDFKLYITDEDIEIPIQYDFSDALFMRDSQVKCAFIYEFTDDDGFDDDNLMDKLPCVVIDGGYRTFGTFFLNKDYSTSVCKSNLDYAMSSVDTAVSSEVSRITGRTTFTALQVKEYLKTQEPINYGTKRITPAELTEMYNRALTATANSSIKFLEKTMELDDARSLLLTGGTGAAYFNIYKAYFNENYGDNLVPVLSDKPYHGKKIDAVFGVVLGLYKQLSNAFASKESSESAEETTK